MQFGLRVWAERLLLPALALSLLPLGACNEKAASDLGFGVSFACEADRELSDQLQLRVLVGGCKADSEARYDVTLAKGESAPPANGIGPGTYGIEATGLHDGELVAYACLVAKLPTSETLDVKLQSDNCDEPEMDAGDEDAEVDVDAEVDASELDGGVDDAEVDATFDEDAGDAEPEVDATPIPCTESCDDKVACTEDSCDTTSGKCLHMAFTGARECDGIACTQNDQCMDGTCAAGTPNNAACVDDGQVCTAEVCVVGTGCTHPTAPANNRGCNDGFACTGADKCTNGVCRGTNNCAAGSVCTVDGSCQVTGCSMSCDDNNPCTTDSCVSGSCVNTPNTLSCNDGQSCTNPDVCSNRVCVGANTCASGSTCGGAICNCNSAGQTLCSGGCFDLTNNPAHCDSCTRACASGYSCENSGCKPGNATGCTAHRYGGHDYLVCNETVTWEGARNKCRSWNMGLAVIDNVGENAFVQQRIGTAARWIGANDRGDNGSNCEKSGDEGTWFWANPNNTSDHATQFCSMSNGSCAATSGRYQNWKSGEPNNSGCQRTCMFVVVCSYTEGEDCGSILPDGTWNDSRCSPVEADRIGYVCESP